MSSNGIVLNSTMYPNNQKIISGAYTVLTDDVTLLCDTSSAPVVINLLRIPNSGGYGKQGNWSTQYKLYIVDYNDNSSANNITVVAPSGFKINAQQQYVMSTNGASVIVEITSNLDYITLGALSAGVSIPYLIATKNLTNIGVTYFPQNINYTIRLGLAASAYDAKQETGIFINSFNLATGIWTVPATGTYDVSCLIYTQINLDANTPTDSVGNFWMNSPTVIGKVSIGLLDTNPYVTQGLITASSITVSQIDSDIILTASILNYPFVAGRKYQVYVLNRTQHDIVGLGLIGNIGNPRLGFSAQKLS